MIAAYCVQRWGEHVATHEGRSPGARFSIQKGAPGGPVAPLQLLPPAASLKAKPAAATQRRQCKLAATAGKLTLSEMRCSNPSCQYCKFALSPFGNYGFYTWQLSLPKLVVCCAGGSPSPTASNCYFPNWKTDISENLALMQPVPLCKHVTFPARRR